MKPFQKCAPTQRYIIETLRKSPMPWTADMIKVLAGRTKHSDSVIHMMKCAGRLIKLQRGIYQAGHD